MTEASETFDVIIVGAGLSGIGMAHHLQRLAPTQTYRIVEARQAIGGTWDLFRYPGVRSDSDMHTLGYSFRPWLDPDAIAGGDKIRHYIEDTAAEAGIDRHISFGVRVKRASWSSTNAGWRVEAENGSVRACRFLIMCAGYYSYDEAHRPSWQDEGSFAGEIVHPQFWPEDLDWRGRRVAVIGSGATAVTLIPALAREAAHVTMIQRSPSYIASRPSQDEIGARLKRVLPARTAVRLTRWKNVLLQMFFFRLARRRPEKARATLIDLVRQEVGDEQLPHFIPTYNVWDQRLCLVPDGDLFTAIRAGTASVVTGEIERFTPSGLRLRSGEEVAADIIVTATGLKVNLAGDVAIEVDGRPVRLSEAMVYKGVMFSDVPNFASIFGYTNASWTLKADLAAAWLCRVVNRMRRTGEGMVIPRRDPDVQERPFLDFTSGYVQRALAILPRQGDRGPWRLPQNYLWDLVALKFGRVADGTLRFVKSGS